MLNTTVPIKTNQYFQHVGSVYCTTDESNPTPVYVVEGNDAVLQCGFGSSSLNWRVHNGAMWKLIADRGDITNKTKYSVSKNSSGLYYRLHIKNVVVSDVKKYRCEGPVNGKIKQFYLQLIYIGRCNYLLVIFNVVKQRFYCCWLNIKK